MKGFEFHFKIRVKHEGGQKMELKEAVQLKVKEAKKRFENFKITPQELAAYIDHTILKPTATREIIERVAHEAIEFGFKSVCVNPSRVREIKELLKNTNIEVCSVVGFPLGANTTYIKAKETEKAIEDGASEIDMVINIGWLKEREYQKVKNDIEEVVKAASGNIVKVIIETCYLDFDEKIKATELIIDSGAHFVKTSTGFGAHGATLEDVALLKIISDDKIKVKAAGGIRTYKDAALMILAGADRIGASRSVDIIKGIM